MKKPIDHGQEYSENGMPVGLSRANEQAILTATVVAVLLGLGTAYVSYQSNKDYKQKIADIAGTTPKKLELAMENSGSYIGKNGNKSIRVISTKQPTHSFEPQVVIGDGNGKSSILSIPQSGEAMDIKKALVDNAGDNPNADRIAYEILLNSKLWGNNTLWKHRLDVESMTKIAATLLPGGMKLDNLDQISNNGIKSELLRMNIPVEGIPCAKGQSDTSIGCYEKKELSSTVVGSYVHPYASLEDKIRAIQDEYPMAYKLAMAAYVARHGAPVLSEDKKPPNKIFSAALRSDIVGPYLERNPPYRSGNVSSSGGILEAIGINKSFDLPEKSIRLVILVNAFREALDLNPIEITYKSGSERDSMIKINTGIQETHKQIQTLFDTVQKIAMNSPGYENPQFRNEILDKLTRVVDSSEYLREMFRDMCTARGVPFADKVQIGDIVKYLASKKREDLLIITVGLTEISEIAFREPQNVYISDFDEKVNKKGYFRESENDYSVRRNPNRAGKGIGKTFGDLKPSDIGISIK